MMSVIVTADVRHLCPHRDEVDYGTVTLVWADSAPELHEVRRLLDRYRDEHITHEALTKELSGEWPSAVVRTRWTTAGMEVECVVPRDESV